MSDTTPVPTAGAPARRPSLWRRLPVVRQLRQSVGLQRGMLVAGLVISAVFVLTAILAPRAAMVRNTRPDATSRIVIAPSGLECAHRAPSALKPRCSQFPISSSSLSWRKRDSLASAISFCAPARSNLKAFCKVASGSEKSP